MFPADSYRTHQAEYKTCVWMGATAYLYHSFVDAATDCSVIDFRKITKPMRLVSHGLTGNMGLYVVFRIEETVIDKGNVKRHANWMLIAESDLEEVVL